MKLGDIANEQAARYGKPLDGVRILAAEQMQALPFATQLLARLGAEVVKVENPVGGDSGRGSDAGMAAPDGSRVGPTFLRNNLDKTSVGLDLKHPRGREIFLELAGGFDVVAENFKAGTMDRLGLGYDVVSERWPHLIYVSVSGFGRADGSPYSAWPAYASVAEAMSGIYDFKREPGRPPTVIPVGALGDISSALFAAIGVLAALRHRESTGLGQLVDVAMYDAMLSHDRHRDELLVARADTGPGKRIPRIVTGFEAADGWFVMQVSREHQFERLATIVGHPEWLDDPRFADPAGLGRSPRRRDPARGRRLGGEQAEARRLHRARRCGAGRRSLQHRDGRRGRSARRRAQHDRRMRADRRCRAAGAGARQPCQDVERRRGAGDACSLAG